LKENNEGSSLFKQGINDKCKFQNIQDVYEETVARASKPDVDLEEKKKGVKEKLDGIKDKLKSLKENAAKI
jgi:Skp family chaperone for outer membrane proteins